MREKKHLLHSASESLSRWIQSDNAAQPVRVKSCLNLNQQYLGWGRLSTCLSNLRSSEGIGHLDEVEYPEIIFLLIIALA